ncbi:hypothetical protein [Actinoallomurus sp. NPDC052274]|uniref:hypothetical protein n=1 Tax=Actinoallomurus sp. NPDC052274 TaxID=3155420 RepID=UPI003439F79D
MPPEEGHRESTAMAPKTGADGHRAISGKKEMNVLKTTSVAGGLIAAAATAGILLTGSPASAQVPTWHGHHRFSSHNHNRNRNVNVNRIIVRVRVHNRNNNVAIARNEGFQPRRFFGRGFVDRGFVDRGRGCCRRFDDDDDFIGRGRFFGDRDGGATAVIRGGDVFARAGDARAFVD